MLYAPHTNLFLQPLAVSGTKLHIFIPFYMYNYINIKSVVVLIFQLASDHVKIFYTYTQHIECLA